MVQAIVLGALLGSLLAVVMKMRPSLELLALVMPGLFARLANEHTDTVLC